MKAEEATIKEKITLAAIYSIEKYGLHAVTARNIAKEAKVNPASIYYYFGSKDNLIKAALKQTIEEAFVNNLNEQMEAEDKNIQKALRDFMIATLDGMFKFPNLTKAHLFEPLIEDEYRGTFVRQFYDFLEEFHKLMKPLLPKKNQKQSRMAIVQLFSALMLPGLVPGIFKRFLGYELSKDKDQAKYVEFLLDSYLE